MLTGQQIVFTQHDFIVSERPKNCLPKVITGNGKSIPPYNQ